MGDALTLPVLKAALAIEIGERSRGFSQRRRAYFIIMWHSTLAEIRERCQHCQCSRTCAALSLALCVMLYQSRQLIQGQKAICSHSFFST